jgi:hypothetical protein
MKTKVNLYANLAMTALVALFITLVVIAVSNINVINL